MTKYRVDFVRNYVRAFGFQDAWRIFHATHFASHRKGELIEVSHPSLKSPLFLRAGTSDISVFESIFVWRQYDISFDSTPQTILDCGGNIGLSVFWFATRFPNAKIVVVEPDPENYKLLLRNTKAFQNLNTLQAGVWSHDCFVRLKQEGVNSDAFSFEPCNPSDSGATQAFGLATIAGRFNLPTLDLLKVDIEGAEEELFTTHFELWLPLAGTIVVECHTPEIRAAVSRTLSQPEWGVSQCGENDVFVRHGKHATATS